MSAPVQTSAQAAARAAAKPLNIAHLAIVLCGMFALLATLSMTFPLLSLLSIKGGLSESVIGLMGAMPSVGLIAAAFFVPFLSRRFGTFRYLIGSAAAAMAVFGLLGVFKTPLAWFPLLFLLGVSVDGIFVICEGWINVLANDQNRGRVIGVYGAVASAGLVVGPAVLSVTGTESNLPFIIGAGCFLLFAVPVAILRKSVPAFEGEHAGGMFGFARMAPAVVMAVLLFGVFETVMGNQFPVFGVAAGLDDAAVNRALSVMFAGYALFQIPLGILAEKFGARRMMLVCAAAGVIGGAAVPFAADAGLFWLWPVMFFWGGLSAGIYTTALIELGQRFSGATMLAGNASFAFAWGLGGIVGPATTGALIENFGADMFGWSLAAAYGLLFVTAGLRAIVRKGAST
ncbi:MAG: MFS transporter [Rhodospirillales bacterium]